MKLSQLSDKTAPIPVEWNGQVVNFHVYENALTPSFIRKMQEASEKDAKAKESGESPNAVMNLFLTQVASSDLTREDDSPLELTPQIFDEIIPMQFTAKLLEKISEVWSFGDKKKPEASPNSSDQTEA